MSDIPGVIVAGTHSGVGKTTTTLAILAGLEQRCDVQPAKAGPDFIDPMHHQAVADQPSRTLDPWLQGNDGMYRQYQRFGGDLCVIEGMMGLYDGTETSTAEVARGLDLPVILVVDANACMESVGAIALGFDQYDDVNIVGIIAQRAHGGKHEEGIKRSLPEEIEYLGRVPPNDDLAIPDRHLGLTYGADSIIGTDSLNKITETLAIEQIRSLAQPPADRQTANKAQQRTNTGKTVAMACDEVFSFYYPETVTKIRSTGELKLFSPVAGDEVPNADVIYLPGGYPELQAKKLADSQTLDEIYTRSVNGTPMYAECGGLMTLAEEIVVTDQSNLTPGHYEMAGVLPAKITFDGNREALGYTELQAVKKTAVTDKGKKYRGHEFHHSKAHPGPDARYVFDVKQGTGINDSQDGLTEYNTVGAYTHFHPASEIFDQLVNYA